MKIELKLSPDTIFAANKLLRNVFEISISNDLRQNVYKSIGFDLSEKFEKKTKSLIKKADLFDSELKSFTIKYHEAWALEEIIRDLIWNEQNPYQKMLLQKLINQLNEKLV
ncbi:hypothetical protein [Zunongwangia profunda]|uniref:hypothetical protein n=1 Tax=Zunongwangia profunda TaxID=398743 RepID=UPI00248DC83B|nr:hypothetical protein [Zunongwangia profunda]|tara:strand:+ start:8391 stop:8723 length:333 start_codon:yes stop_codon:yes gene_type:complete